MNNIPKELIKEIAGELELGYRVFMHKTTGQLVLVLSEEDLANTDAELWQEELELLKNNPDDYLEIEKWRSSQAYGMMADFAQQLTHEPRLYFMLSEALNKRKPFREFKHVIDNAGDYRQLWFEFKSKWQQDFVARQLDRLKEEEEEDNDDDND